MKNIALIKSIIAASISSANTAELTEHIVALIQAHPEEIRENALAILTGTAELTVRPVDQVELTCNSSNYTNLSFMGEPVANLLEGTVRCSVNYTRTKTSEYYLDSNSASRKLIKLSNHGTDCFSQPAHRSRIYVGCSQLWHCSTSLHLSGAAQAAERRQGHGRRPCTHGCRSRYVGRCNQERALSPFFNSFCYG